MVRQYPRLGAGRDRHSRPDQYLAAALAVSSDLDRTVDGVAHEHGLVLHPVLRRADVDARGERVGQRRALVGVRVEPARLLDVADVAEPAGVLAVHPDRRAQGVDQRVALDDDGLGGGHDLLLYKSNRGSPWTAISRRSKRSHFLRSGRPSAPSLDSSPNLSLALRRRSVGSLSSCRRRRHWMVSHIWLTPRRRAMAGHVSGACHRGRGCARAGWFTNMSRPPD